MKNKASIIFRVLIILILAGKVSNWVFHYSDEVNRMLNASMFSFIGLAYIAMGLSCDKNWVKYTLMTCGLFLIAMNFFVEYTAVTIIGIGCLLIPMAIFRFVKDSDNTTTIDDSEESLIEQ